MITNRDDARLLSRRFALGWLGGLGTATAIGCLTRQAGLVDDEDAGTTAAEVAIDGNAPDTSASAIDASDSVTTGTCPVTCQLTPEQELGPYYVDLGLVRSDVRESQAGITLVLTLTVLDSTTCAPLANAAVEIWSANAAGVYSAEASENTTGQTFLRGVQITNACGEVTFVTLYPGWYEARANHVHVKVRVGTARNVAHVGQMFFDQVDNDAVRLVAPYTANANPYVIDAEDRVYAEEEGGESLVRLTGSATGSAGFHGKIVLVVDRAAAVVEPADAGDAG